MSYQAPPPGESGYYGQPPYGGPPKDHPRAMLAMILGILGLVVCSILAFPAYFIGKNAVAEIDASGGMIGGRGMANAGKIMGLIGIILLVLGVLLMIVLLATGALTASTTDY